MDYSTDPSINQSPNNEDYVVLESIYTSTTSPTTDSGGEETASKPCRGKKCKVAFMIEDETLDKHNWGKRKGGHGRHEIYERRLENNRKLITIVTRVK